MTNLTGKLKKKTISAEKLAEILFKVATQYEEMCIQLAEMYGTLKTIGCWYTLEACKAGEDIVLCLTINFKIGKSAPYYFLLTETFENGLPSRKNGNAQKLRGEISKLYQKQEEREWEKKSQEPLTKAIKSLLDIDKERFVECRKELDPIQNEESLSVSIRRGGNGKIIITCPTKKGKSSQYPFNSINYLHDCLNVTVKDFCRRFDECVDGRV
ncbi:MAG: hypothetical protein PHT54_02675 [Candidatus Nanoarchaeia archaeon]|nr:hypothetical protein [Candidatus Nanoarchaeia archaeon]